MLRTNQKTPMQLQRYHAATLGRFGLGRLGAAPAALPTQPGSGTGWILVVVTAPPNATITWQQTGGTSPSMMLIDQPPVGGLQEISAGNGDTNRAWNFIAQNETFTFYLLPMDSAQNTYAPVESVVAQGAPGIYASPSVPASVLASAQAANPGLQVYGQTPPPAGTVAAAPWYDTSVSIFGTSVPVWGMALVGLGLVFASSKKL